MELKEIKLADIVISKTNPRKTFDEQSIEELAQSIIEKGVLQPIVVRVNGKPGKYELVCGERRVRASLKAQTAKKTITTIPAVIRQLTNEEALEVQIIENLQRKDVHPMEEAVAFKGLIDLKKFDVHEIAKRIGKGPQYVAQRLKLNDLIGEFQKAFFQDRMTTTTAFALAKLRAEDQKEIWEDDYAGNEQKIELDRWTLNRYKNDLNDPPFDKEDISLNPTMGACSGCQFNSASNTLLFPDTATNAICLNSECFKTKCDKFFTKELHVAKGNPEVVLVSGNFSTGKDENELIKKGEQVFNRHQYDLHKKPEAPVYADFEEDLQDGDYDTKEEMQKYYDREVKSYETECEQYSKMVESGKLIKAFVVAGDNKGKYIYVKLTKNAKAAKSTAAGAQSKEDSGAITIEDIKAEIERIKDAEKRKKELDLEKIHFATNELFQKYKKFAESQEALGVEELRGAVLFLFETNYNAKGTCEKLLKSQGSYSNADLAIYKKLEAMKHSQLSQVFHAMLRTSILAKLSPTKGGANQRPDANGHAAAFNSIAKLYMPKEIEEIEMNQLNERANREVRVDARIKSLTKKISELKSAKK